MDMKTFDPKDPIAILAFLSNFKTACDALGIQEATNMWLLKPLMREPPKSALNMHVSPLDSSFAPKKGQITSYCGVVNYLLLTYASKDIIAKEEAEVQQFKQGPRLSKHNYATALNLKAMRCGAV